MPIRGRDESRTVSEWGPPRAEADSGSLSFCQPLNMRVIEKESKPAIAARSSRVTAFAGQMTSISEAIGAAESQVCSEIGF
jgi:hypothetical protein